MDSRRSSSRPTTDVPLQFIQFNRANDKKKRLGLLSLDGATVRPFPDGTYDNDMITFIKAGIPITEESIKALKPQAAEVLENSNIHFLPPVTNPEKIVCLSANYQDFIQEKNRPMPDEPTFSNKLASCLVGHNGHVVAHKITKKLDYEVEMAVIMGKKGKNISKEDALDYVFGYSVAQDISARDWQEERNGGQFFMSKSMDTFCPLGPAIVHKSYIKNPYNLQLTTKVNGVVKQNSNTNKMIFKIADIIYELTKSVTLKPGDVILTGTPSGVAMHRNPPDYLRPGDTIETEIPYIGKLCNKVVADV